ncbi:MAG: class II aldolase/adducin family protein, partial [Desulfatiglandales bacterium]
MKAEDPKKKLVRAARHLYRRGLTPGSGGNLSLTEDGRIYITPSGISFRELTPMDISIIDLGGNRISGPKP